MGNKRNIIKGTQLEEREGRHPEAPETAGDEVIEGLQFSKRQESVEREVEGHINCITYVGTVEEKQISSETHQYKCRIDPNSMENPVRRHIAQAASECKRLASDSRS